MVIGDDDRRNSIRSTLGETLEPEVDGPIAAETQRLLIFK